MRIKVLTRFLDDKDTFEMDDIRSVEESKGAYFVANGWAEDLSNAVALPEVEFNNVVELEVQDSILGSGDNNA